MLTQVTDSSVLNAALNHQGLLLHKNRHNYAFVANLINIVHYDNKAKLLAYYFTDRTFNDVYFETKSQVARAFINYDSAFSWLCKNAKLSVLLMNVFGHVNSLDDIKSVAQNPHMDDEAIEQFYAICTHHRNLFVSSLPDEKLTIDLCKSLFFYATTGSEEQAIVSRIRKLSQIDDSIPDLWVLRGVGITETELEKKTQVW